MRRRMLVALVGAVLGATLNVPLAAAQQSRRVPRIVYVYIFKEGPSRPYEKSFIQRLGELGWIDGQTVNVEVKDADGDPAKLTAIMQAAVDSKVDVIVAAYTPEGRPRRL